LPYSTQNDSTNLLGYAKVDNENNVIILASYSTTARIGTTNNSYKVTVYYTKI
jgi:hypothetical protein